MFIVLETMLKKKTLLQVIKHFIFSDEYNSNVNTIVYETMNDFFNFPKKKYIK